MKNGEEEVTGVVGERRRRGEGEGEETKGETDCSQVPSSVLVQ